MTAAKQPFPWVQRHQPLAQGLLAACLLGDGSGLTFRDTSGRGRDLVASATPPTWVATPYGWGISTNGTSSNCSISQLMVTSGPFSFAVLVAPASISASCWILAQGLAATGSEIAIGINSTGVPRWEIGGSAIVGTTALTLNAWVTLVMTYDATRTNHMIAYTNGAQDQTSTANANYTGETSKLGSGPNNSSFYSGKIAGAMIWNRSLSQSEASQLGADFFLPARKRRTVTRSAVASAPINPVALVAGPDLGLPLLSAVGNVPYLTKA